MILLEEAVCWEPLGAALTRLDELLEAAAERATVSFAAGAADDPFRGLYVAREEVERLLLFEPGHPVLGGAVPTQGSGPLAGLGGRLGLDAFELDVLVLALAPEFDLRYERIIAYLHDDVSRRRPSVGLALDLLASTAAEKFALRARFALDAPLFRSGALALFETEEDLPLLARGVRASPLVLEHLAGRRPPRLTGVTWEPVPRASEAVAGSISPGSGPLRLRLRAETRQLRIAAAGSLAASFGTPLAIVDGDGLPERERARDVALAVRLWQPTVLLEPGRGGGAAAAALAELDAAAPPALLVGGGREDEWLGHGLGELQSAPPAPGERRREWAEALTNAGVGVSTLDLDELAERYPLTPVQVETAAAAAAVAMRIGSGASEAAFAAARSELRPNLGTLARRLEPRFGWRDIVLPEDEVAQLREICAQVRTRDRVIGEWGFGSRFGYGTGVNVLFSGPPGTGKTMAAEVIAADLRLDLFRIDLSQVVDKYVGETEKRLERIFGACEGGAAILLFDEADALFGKRSETKDAHDRYANVEVAYLLQRIETYDGVAILTTNLRANVDQAFIRRLAFAVEFPPPTEELRLEIWRRVWPQAARLADDVDFAELASRFPLSGGHIRNIALAAAHLAAADGAQLGMGHVLHAVRREYQKLGHLVVESALTGEER